jgi:transposase-like protein
MHGCRRSRKHKRIDCRPADPGQWVASEIAPAAWFLRVITATISVLFGVSVMRCPVCGSTAVKERLERTAQGYRRFRCRCGKQFNERSTGLLNRTQYPSNVIALVVLWRLRYKLSLRDLAEMFLIRGFFRVQLRSRPRLGSQAHAGTGRRTSPQAKGQSGPELVRRRDIYPSAWPLEVPVSRD